MNRDNSHIDEWLKQQLDGAELQPAPELWDAIEAKMDRSTRRKLLIWWAAAAVVLVSGLGIWTMSQQSPAGATVAGSDSPVIETPAQVQSVPSSTLEVQVPAESEVEALSAPLTAVRTQQLLTSQDQEVLSFVEPLAVPAFVPQSRGLSTRVFLWEPFLQNHLVVSEPRDTQGSEKGLWYLEVGFDQNQTGILYTAVSERSSYIHKNYFDRVNQGEFSLQSSRLSVSLERDLTEHWRAHSGLAWAQNRRGQDFDFQDSMPASSSVGTTADAFGNYPIFGYLGLGDRVQYSGQTTLNFLSIPLGMSYRFAPNGTWRWMADVQLQANRISVQGGKTLNYHYLTLEDWSQVSYKSWFASSRLSVGMERELREGLSWSVSGNMQGALTPLYQSGSAVKANAWSAGLSTQLTWSLKGGRR
ncbi:MAG: hypothetical protein O3C22_02805 [Bacteroidetes bacterium]|nr:hypothetical protein [Bacteroidota bacterium]MDA0943212.1 hypothetical protein [Bacteroidota bacterium]MDA1111199.1 hypothetical protein [Bacteroidota bacterium]